MLSPKNATRAFCVSSVSGPASAFRFSALGSGYGAAETSQKGALGGLRRPVAFHAQWQKRPPPPAPHSLSLASTQGCSGGGHGEPSKISPLVKVSSGTADALLVCSQQQCVSVAQRHCVPSTAGSSW